MIYKILFNLSIFIISVIILIFLARISIKILLYIVAKTITTPKNKIKNYINTKQKKFDKVDEELIRYKASIPKAHSAVKAENLAKKKEMQMIDQNVEIIESTSQKHEIDKPVIIDIVKPVGFWTSMILGQKLTYLIQSAQQLNKRGDKGFWASMIEAQERQAGRQHGRTR